ncbi:MAG: hypothetical protein ABIX01_10525 [Chitinophagaceae bacterium]
MTFKPAHISRMAIALGCILPVVLLFGISLSQNWAFPKLLPQQFTAANWSALFTKGNSITTGLFTSLIIALLVASLATASGFFTSQVIAYHRFRRQLIVLAYLPFVISPVIFAVCLKFYFIRMNLVGNIMGIVLAQLIIAFPYSIIFFVGFWNQRIKQYQMAVNTLGGSNGYAFSKVIVPLSRPMLLVCFFQCFLISWFEYGLTSIIGYGKVQTLTIKVFDFLTEANLYYAALSCCLLIIPPVILLWLNKRIIFRRIE